MDDISLRAINPLFTNIQIVDELNSQLKAYARKTKGIEDVYSFPLYTKAPFVSAPPLALRSESYHFLGYISQGTIFGMDMRNMPEVYNTFRYSPVQGIANWIMPWGAGHNQYLSVFPMGSTTPDATTLSSSVNASVTTIPVVSTAGFVNNHGRITIGTEKILYGYKDATNFYNCVRGVETTVAASHSANDAVIHNNFFIHYARLPIPITVESDGTLSVATLATVLDPCDEHLEGIVKATAYNLLIKVDAVRAKAYQIDADKLYDEYKLEIMRGQYTGRQGTGVRQPFPTNESGTSYGGNLTY